MPKISGISYYLPELFSTVEDLSSEFPEWSVEKIALKTGIYKRHIAGINETSADLGIESAKLLFKEFNISPSDIDFILFCTQSPDYFLPTTACIMQDKLGIPTSAGALDFNLGCSGFVYGLSLANSLIIAGDAENVLLITAETYSKFIHPKDKSVRTIFGDAGASCLITKSDNKNIGPFVFGTDGKGAENLMVKSGGMRFPSTIENVENIDEYGNIHTDGSLYMNGAEIFTFTLKSVPAALNKLLQKAGLNLEDIDLFIFHQANKYMLESLRKKMNIPEEKFYIYINNVGNTVSSTIPIALKHAIDDGIIKSGFKVAVIGFGVGYSWAGSIITF